MPAKPLNRSGGLSAAWLLVLAFLSMTAPLSTDLYLPSFPRVQQEFAATASGVQLTLTGFLLGMAAGQLAFGAISDKFGRLRPLLIGNVGAILSSVAAALAPNLEVLVAARLGQGLFGAAGIVIARAIIVDLTRGSETARTLSLLMTVNGVAPAVAPSLGALLEGPIGWRGIMWTLAGLFALMMLSVSSVFRETLPPESRGEHGILGGLAQLFRVPRYLGYAGLFATSFAAMMSYIPASPFVYQVVMGLPPLAYGALFGLNAAGLIIAGYISSRLVKRIPAQRIVAVAAPLLLVFCAAILALALAPVPRWLLAIPIWCAVTSVGFLMGNSSALALGAVRHVSGSGSAVLGATQFVFGAIVSPLSGLAGDHTAVPMAVIMTVAAAVAAVLALVLRRRHG
ncbi:Bicyclomycin resistance protein [Sinomonas atrocyanea]|uniref:Bicyclomycin resistance protein n=1 Tax=Sinomonas atrocyanea TaxID=37927 RepID=A0A127A589_9MICC|nr:multidrug effflux MFS transporter [Sinomonas atrocyanea]AMM34256.1 Bicyclomycin resistance protein [Sinomonas atrocyanea]GEB64715.1 Bcr/CflA family drug resistance efflux transporter [Sinomonas atrocyanea]GGG66455.1 Bcr/CflA family drug resistance efflux transporter [Sinomonas atrocyanea]